MVDTRTAKHRNQASSRLRARWLADPVDRTLAILNALDLLQDDLLSQREARSILIDLQERSIAVERRRRAKADKAKASRRKPRKT